MGLAILVSSVIDINPVEARCRSNGWCQGGYDSQGNACYVKKVGGRWPFIQYKQQCKDKQGNDLFGIYLVEADCSRDRKRWLTEGIQPRGWTDVLPGSIGESNLVVVCN